MSQPLKALHALVRHNNYAVILHIEPSYNIIETLKFFQNGRYTSYQFDDDQCVWTTSHNSDHGYVHDIIAISVHGKQSNNMVTK